MRGGWRAGVTLSVVAAAVVALGGCSGKQIEGQPQAMGDIDTSNAGGLEVSDDGPTGPRDGVEDAKLDVEGADGGEMDRLATNSIADLYEYWHEQLPAQFDEEYKELERLVSYDSNGAGVTICGASTAGLVNAFYCGGNGEDAIAWDRGQLLPMLNEQFGPMSVVGVLAHEMGHAVQFRLGEKSNMSQTTPTIVREQQADCYMGNFFKYVAEDKSKHFQINTGKGLNDILATLFFIRDPAGLDHQTEGAHGLAFDRVYAFQEGFSNDPKRCADMDEAEIESRIAEKERTETEQAQSDEGDIDPIEVLDKLQASLDEAFKDNETDAAEDHRQRFDVRERRRDQPGHLLPGRQRHRHRRRRPAGDRGQAEPERPARQRQLRRPGRLRGVRGDRVALRAGRAEGQGRAPGRREGGPAHGVPDRRVGGRHQRGGPGSSASRWATWTRRWPSCCRRRASSRRT